tara:strand:- start:397 stop:582 length:186 start_codon:yes stop_codon:yes gene_type:complete
MNQIMNELKVNFEDEGDDVEHDDEEYSFKKDKECSWLYCECCEKEIHKDDAESLWNFKKNM